MDDQALVREVDGGGDHPQQRDARRNVERPRAAVLGDRHALDELHDDVVQPVVGPAGVEQAGDVRMLQAREDPPLVPEPAQRFRHGQAGRQELHRDLLLELVVAALGQPDRAHAAAADLAHEPVRSDVPSGERRLELVRAVEGVERVQRTAAVVLGEQRSHLRGKVRTSGAGARDEGLALGTVATRARRRGRGRPRSRDRSS